MTCTRCDGTGFLNLFQVGDDLLNKFWESGDEKIVLAWIKEHDRHEVSVCDCCGNGENWHGTRGEHYTTTHDCRGGVAYKYNGGLAECH